MNKFKVIIAGGRDFNDYDLLMETATEFLIMANFPIMFDGNDLVEIVSGGARGADKLGERFAEDYGFDIKRFIPKWQNPDGSTDRGAGIKRNHEMGNYANALIAYWDGKSSGTRDMINYARKKGLIVKVVYYE